MWLVAAGFLHVTARNFIANSTLSHHVSVLGYSALPLIPVKLFLFLCPVPFHLDYLIMLLEMGYILMVRTQDGYHFKQAELKQHIFN